MNVHLMYEDRDFDMNAAPGWNDDELIRDLELDCLFDAMASGDSFIRGVVSKAFLMSLHDIGTIKYRQDILSDCLRNISTIREIYSIAITSMENERNSHFGIFCRYPVSILHSSIDALNGYIATLEKLKKLAIMNCQNFTSRGFTAFFKRLGEELSDSYLEKLRRDLDELNFRDGISISASFGEGNKAADLWIHRFRRKNSWFDKIRNLFRISSPSNTFTLDERDEAGARAIARIQDMALNRIANTLAQSVEHIRNFFHRLRTELAFYMGCINLHTLLSQKNYSLTFPEPATRPGISFRSLFDIYLALKLEDKIVTNDMDKKAARLVMITGANQGGKTVFLRSIATAMLMMQCGMFVPADSFQAPLHKNFFTHFRRREDSKMKSGKLDEELSRMSGIVDHMTPGSIIFFNESFATTNSREGSEIASQIILALLECDIDVIFVTHLYPLARKLHDLMGEKEVFLRAERRQDGTRTFKIIPGEPVETSYGQDIYSMVFEQ